MSWFDVFNLMSTYTHNRRFSLKNGGFVIHTFYITFLQSFDYVYTIVYMKSRITTFAKWGNSIGIRVPDIFIETMQVSPGDNAEVRYAHGVITIRPQKKKMTMQERLANIRPNNLNIDREWINMQPVGNEVWEYEQ